MTTRFTRSLDDCPIAGKRSGLSLITLPTSGDVLRHWLKTRYELEEPGNIVSRHEMVINIWTSASIPIITPEGIT